MKPRVVAFAHRLWYRRSPLALLFLPFSLLFGIIAATRRAAYRRGLLKREHLAVPVIVVGNLVAGGAGKTPLVLWLVAQLRARGWRPGILSRGYQGQNETPRAVLSGADPVEVGDEPALLAERSGVPVWIGRRRVAAGRALLAAHPQCNVLVCDDGLQHYALVRDFEIAVEDERGMGNGRLLPAGPLREAASRRVDATVTNGTQRAGAYAMRFDVAGFYPIHDPEQSVSLGDLRAKRLHAVAGIGNPERFFRQLEALGLRFVAHAFPDHHRYRSEDLRFDDCDTVLMTEKDAVKCRAFGRTDLVALRIEAVVDPALADLIETRLHGSATA
ncbi:MAG TPA: tetraacyldisaccharide 4'-kinase [Burkholderiales bacterium]